ncbi:OSTB protein, partial [Urocolius indicus]|nr:OSTB protein [Urocolius indicus]
MRIFWIISFLLLQGAEAFLMKNAKAKLCLQANPQDGSLLLEDCAPESALQDWAWEGHSLLNRGTRRCLAVAQPDRVQAGPCHTSHASWACSTSLLSPLGSSQGYLVATGKGAALSHSTGLRAQWQDGAERSVCEEEAEAARPFPAALASTHTVGNVSLALGMDQEQLEELLWFFRTEDPSTWNYSVLALSFVTMLLGLLLLAINVVQNRKRKNPMYRAAVQGEEEAELEGKQALMSVQEQYSPAEPQEQERAGEVTVQWKDGTVTSLYSERAEDTL